MTGSRDLRERIVRGLAMVGLVWALAVLGFVFTAGAAAGSSPAPDSSATGAQLSSGDPGGAPRTAGLALALVVLGGGITVLAIGGQRAPLTSPAALGRPRRDDADDLPLPRGLTLAPYSPA